MAKCSSLVNTSRWPSGSEIGQVDELQSQPSPPALARRRVAFQDRAAAGSGAAGGHVDVALAVHAEGCRAVEPQIAEPPGHRSGEDAPSCAEGGLQLRRRVDGVVDLDLLVSSRVGHQQAIFPINGHGRGNDAGGKLDLLRQPPASGRETQGFPRCSGRRTLQDPHPRPTIEAQPVRPLDVPGAKPLHALGVVDLDRAVQGAADEEFRFGGPQTAQAAPAMLGEFRDGQEGPLEHVALLAVAAGKGRRPGNVAAMPPGDTRPGEALGRPGAPLQSAPFVFYVLHDEQVLGVGRDGLAALVSPAVRVAGHGHQPPLAVLLDVPARLVPPHVGEQRAVRLHPQAFHVLLHPGRLPAEAVADPRHAVVQIGARACRRAARADREQYRQAHGGTA